MNVLKSEWFACGAVLDRAQILDRGGRIRNPLLPPTWSSFRSDIHTTSDPIVSLPLPLHFIITSSYLVLQHLFVSPSSIITSLHHHSSSIIFYHQTTSSILCSPPWLTSSSERRFSPFDVYSSKHGALRQQRFPACTE